MIFDMFIYVLGRIFKRGWLEKMPLKWLITEKDLDYFTGWFSKNAVGVLWLSRFIPGSRFPAYFSAGLCRYPFFSFMLHFIASTLVWAPLLGTLAYILGQEMMNYYESYYGYIPQLILGLGFSLYFLFIVSLCFLYSLLMLSLSSPFSLFILFLCSPFALLLLS